MGIAIVVVPLALVLSLAAAGQWLAVAQTPKPVCGNVDMQEQIRTGMYVALDEGFRQQVTSLFLVWMKDGRAQPGRAKAGVDLAVDAYIRGYKAVEEWRLPPC